MWWQEQLLVAGLLLLLLLVLLVGVCWLHDDVLLCMLWRWRGVLWRRREARGRPTPSCCWWCCSCRARQLKARWGEGLLLLAAGGCWLWCWVVVAGDGGEAGGWGALAHLSCCVDLERCWQPCLGAIELLEPF